MNATLEYIFPPPPQGYAFVLIVRGLLLAWSLIGLGILIHRLRHWKWIREKEFGWWLLAGFVSFVVANFGYCGRTSWDDNSWLGPIVTAAFSVSVTGITIVVCKLYVDGPNWKPYAVIVGILGLGTCFLFVPTTSTPREASRRTRCRNNLKQIGLAFQNLHDANQQFPPSVSGSPPVTWRVSILPYIDQQAVFREYDSKISWNEGHNAELAKTAIPHYTCPSNERPKDLSGRWFSAYSMLTGSGTIGESETGTTWKQITDGMSNTLIVVEACGADIVWTEPREIDVDSRPAGINLKGREPGQSKGWMSAYHDSHVKALSQVDALLADGSVRSVSVHTDPKVLKKLVTIAGGDDSFDDEW